MIISTGICFLEQNFLNLHAKCSRRKKMNKFKMMLVTILLLLTITSYGVNVPEVLNFQGALKQANGEPVNDTQIMDFRIYDAITGGNLLWSEMQMAVTIEDGIFSVELGNTTSFPTGLFDNSELYITYYFGGSEMSPRQRLIAVPYVLNANKSAYADSSANTGMISSIPLSGLVQQDGSGNATISGTMTANAFVGDGSGLTGLSDIYDDVYVNETGPDTMTANHLDDPVLTLINESTQNAFGLKISDTNSSDAGIFLESIDGDGIEQTNTTGYAYRTNNNGTGFRTHTSSNDGMQIINTGADGIWMYGIADNGVYIDSTGNDAIFIKQAGNPSAQNTSSAKNGLEIAGAEGNGLYVGRADNNGININSAGDDGVSIVSASDDGVYIGSVGSPGSSQTSSDKNGFEVAGAEDNGLFIGYSGDDGVYVGSASNGIYVDHTYNTGVYIDSSNYIGTFIGSAPYGFRVQSSLTGLEVNSATGRGVFVGSVGSPDSTQTSSSKNGFQVDGAEGNGLYVGHADDNGVNVSSAGVYGINIEQSGSTGIQIHNAGSDGIKVDFAGDDGVSISSADGDGVYVNSVGTPSTNLYYSSLKNGFEIVGAEGNGLYVGRADNCGIYVNSAGESGVYIDTVSYYGVLVNKAQANGLYVSRADIDGVSINSAGFDGVYITSAGDDGIDVSSATDIGVYANTSNGAGEWGFDTPDKIRGSNITTRSISTYGKNDGNTVLEPGDIVCLTGYEENILGDSDIPIIKVTKAGRKNSEAIIGVVEYCVVIEEEIDEAGKMGNDKSRKRFSYTEGNANPGDYISLIIIGPANVKIDSREDIRTGESLTSNNGWAKKVRTTEVNGITIAENIGIIGKALEDSKGKGNIKVFVGCK